ncbi:MAG: hypothetical protein ABIH48_03185 [Candidatus Falkowbacteria bacterium]
MDKITAEIMADKIFHNLINGWEQDRSCYQAEPEEIIALLKGGGTATLLNSPYQNTLEHQIEFRGKTFVGFSINQLNIMQKAGA